MTNVPTAGQWWFHDCFSTCVHPSKRKLLPVIQKLLLAVCRKCKPLPLPGISGDISHDTMCRLPLGGNHTATTLRSAWPLAICVALVVTAQTTTAKTSSTPKNHQQHKHQRGCGPTDQLRRSRLLQPQHRGVPATGSERGKGVQSSAWLSHHAERSTWTVRGGQLSNNRDEAEGGGGAQNTKREGDGEQPRYFRDFPPSGARDHQAGVSAAAEKIEKIAADFRTKTDDLAADVRARGEAIAADLKAKQEKITDEVLRDRSPEAFGELGGHHTPYDPTTAGMDVANRRAFFLGVRRVVLLAQVVELIIVCCWQAAFPYGGVAGFVASGGDSTAATSGRGGDGTGRLGLAFAAVLGQAAVYTIMLAFFGCDRVVLKAVNVTGWEHVAAAVWVLTSTFGAPGKLPHLAACAWLTGMAFLCLYFGRQL